MAMTKVQQKEAAGKIMAKLGPMDAVEQKTYELLMRKPEDYIAPDPNSGERVCGICGEVFQAIPATRENPEVTALQQFADHQTEHNPTAPQWAEAYHRIKSFQERAKQSEKDAQG